MEPKLAQELTCLRFLVEFLALDLRLDNKSAPLILVPLIAFGQIGLTLPLAHLLVVVERHFNGELNHQNSGVENHVLEFPSNPTFVITSLVLLIAPGDNGLTGLLVQKSAVVEVRPEQERSILLNTVAFALIPLIPQQLFVILILAFLVLSPQDG